MSNYIFNDGGREAAGYKGTAGDCVARAIAIACEMPYSEVYEALCGVNKATKGKRSARSGILTKSFDFKKYMASLGWSWTPTMLVGQGCKVHLTASELPAGRLICAVSKHYCAVIDGVIHDIYDPSREGTRCVYGYWSKK
jgi:hypothetical protein